ncbi:rod-determining factor RdfA [Haloplanus salilacus]|uniref:rod-determining factor RdfA n=1 Tax=Haloplanus salilacus TaxID=2949994 RepID=UPI0030CB04CB
MTDEDRTESGPKSNKVARLLEKYDLGVAFGDELERRWTADGEERESLRDLADRFNRRLLERALLSAGASTVDGEIENLYRLLTADDVSSGMRTEARTRLERDGVDVDGLERDFVSYQAIRSYLTEYRDAEYDSPSASDRVRSVRETIQRLRSRLRSVTEGSLERLQSTDRLTLGTFRLFVDVDVLCEDCGSQYGIVELLERGGCDCERDG